MVRRVRSNPQEIDIVYSPYFGPAIDTRTILALSARSFFVDRPCAGTGV